MHQHGNVVFTVNMALSRWECTVVARPVDTSKRNSIQAAQIPTLK